MVFEHDFEKFPELTNRQMQFYYFESPHKQILEDIRVKVERVIDGDTISVSWNQRNFLFPIRFLGTDAKELNEGGEDAKSWLENQILNEEVDILINPNQRVGKFGRLLGKIISRGMDMGDMMIRLGRATTFDDRNLAKLPSINKELNLKRWL